MYCKKCGTEISDNQKFCPKCGTSIRADNELSTNIIKNKKSHKIQKIISIVLVLTLIAGIGSFVGFKVYRNGKYCSSRIIAEYDSEKNISRIQEVTYRQDDQVLESVVYEVEDNGSKTIIIKGENTYDAEGKLIKISYIDNSSLENKNYTASLNYIEEDNQYIGKGYYSDNSGAIKVVYDKNIYKVSETHYNDMNELTFYKEKYDSEGNLIETIEYENGKETYKFVYENQTRGAKTTGYYEGILSYIYELNFPEKYVKHIEYDESGEIESDYSKNYKVTEESQNVYRVNQYEEGIECTTEIYAFDGKIGKEATKLLKREFRDSNNTDGYYVADRDMTYNYSWKDFSKINTWKEVLFK